MELLTMAWHDVAEAVQKPGMDEEVLSTMTPYPAAAVEKEAGVVPP